MLKPVIVVDYGRGNLLSVCRALEAAGAVPEVSGDPERVVAAERLVLPGVGAFGDAMASLDRLGLSDAVRAFGESERPFFGICLGMQLMMERSSEFGDHRGLGLIAGHVDRLPQNPDSGLPKVPNVGWCRLEAESHRWEDGPLSLIAPGDYCYFVHSFHAKPEDPDHVLATIRFDGRPVAAAIRQDNRFGCQFHPEKSGAVGRRILTAWLQ